LLTLGIDTSNYTTSAAVFNSDTGEIYQSKKLLPVAAGSVGIRQSDAVFHHTRQLPEIIENLFNNSKFENNINRIGASNRPRNIEGSYMPCFTVGDGTAKSISSVTGIPLFNFSHQQGHIAAAAYGSGNLELLNSTFIAFHISGGTTEAVMVTPDLENIINCEYLAGSSDLKAGQAIDRIGVMLSLKFPAGPALEELANKCTDKIKVKPVIKGLDCSISGIENKCKKMFNDGIDNSYIARYCLEFIGESIIGITDKLIEKYGKLPLLYAGGVMSDKIIRDKITDKYKDAIFSPPQFSCDNAAGIAILTAMKK